MTRRLLTITLILFVNILLLSALFGISRGVAQKNASAADSALAALGTAFTYQGRLVENGVPANGDYDFIFTLYDSPQMGSGTQIGSTILDTITVSDGWFTAQLDFGDVYDGTALWMEVSVRPVGSLEDYTTLSPRQALTPTPFAAYAAKASWNGLRDVPGGFADNVDNDSLAGLSCASGAIPEWSGSTWVCGTDDIGTSGAAWWLTGNGGTTPGTNFLGTTDNQPLAIHVNGTRALLIEPDPNSPNLIGGYAGNSSGTGVVGGTIGGGGRDLAINQVNANYSTVGGGAGNTASGYASTTGGGEGNLSSASYSTVAGGSGNQAKNDYSTIGGGSQNNTSGNHASVGGGNANVISATFGTISGGGANIVSATYGTIAGGFYNEVSAAYSTVAGGGPSDLGNPTTSNNQVHDEYGTISGGGGNTAGSDDSLQTNALGATVGGGVNNTAGASYATTSGGHNNSSSGYAATIGGGDSNNATNNYATITGGTGNAASGLNATVAGGKSNTASQLSATVGGGEGNQAIAGFATIPGGRSNYVSGLYGFAAGYQANAEHQGSFVWSDSKGTPFTSTGNDQFLIRAAGGVGIGTETPSQALTVDGSAALLGSGNLVLRGVYTNTMPYLDAPSAIDAAGSTIYVTSYSTNTLTIIDVSDPDNPQPIGATTSNLNGPSDVQVMDGLAYITSELNHRLVIFDTSNPSNPDSLGSTNHNLNNPKAVYISGKYAYVASFTGADDGLAIFDVTDPGEISPKGFTSANLDGTSDVYVVGNTAYVTSQNNDRLAIFDVSDPDDIIPRGYASGPLNAPVAVQVRGSYAYVLGSSSNNLVVFNISNPDTITYVGEQSTTLTRPQSLFVSGDHAYVAYAGDEGTANNSGLAVFDISDPANIDVLSVIDMSTSQPYPEKPVGIYGNSSYIYVANESHDSVSIYEINHLETPAIDTGNLLANQLDVTGAARVNNDLSVRGGLNVGEGGALIQGELAVAGKDDNYILGALSIGSTGKTITGTEEIQFTYPTHKLDVSGDARFRVNEHNNLLIFSENEDARLDFTKDSYTTVFTPTASIVFDASDPITHTTSIVFATQGPDDLTIKNRVEVGENGNLRPAADNSYSLGESGKRWTTVHAVNGVIQTSDGRLKENISTLPYGLEQVQQLQPVVYNWVDGPVGDIHLGLVAQDVQKVLPEVVSAGDDPAGLLSMNYSEIVPVLVNAIQEQQTKIESQEAQILALEARLSALESSQDGLNPHNGFLSTLNLTWLFSVLGGATFVIVALRRKGDQT